MSAFNHDWDHMGGFWKLVPRGGKTKRARYREVDIGSINPFGEGDGADTPIAGLGLGIGDRLKYVYDFGDWIKHRIELEAIVEPDKDAKYPRIVGQNKPRHHYCPICKQAGKKEIATRTCITCSNRFQEDVYICKNCAEHDHEDHYIEVILY